MRRLACSVFLTLRLAQAAFAQDNSGQDSNVIAVPPAPPLVAAPSVIPAQPLPPPATPAPPGLVVTPAPPLNADTGAPAPAVPPAPAPPANNWLPGATVKLGVLDKIDGTVSEITIATGAQATVGDLLIAVNSCVTRPAGEVPDAAVFLTAQSQQDPAAPPLYRGWIVRSIPGATVVGDASETFRIIGCS